jgi:hypothetical protein
MAPFRRGSEHKTKSKEMNAPMNILSKRKISAPALLPSTALNCALIIVLRKTISSTYHMMIVFCWCLIFAASFAFGAHVDPEIIATVNVGSYGYIRYSQRAVIT